MTRDGYVQLLDVALDEPQQTFQEDAIANSGIFNAAGTRIITGSTGNIAQLWNVHHSAPLRTFHRGGTEKMSDDGSRVLNMGDRRATLWDVSIDHRPVAVQIREHQHPTGTRLDDRGQLRVMRHQKTTGTR